MQRFLAWVGPLAMLAILLNWARQYGREGEGGPPYGMRSSLLATDGRHYRDGTEVDPVTLWLVGNGREEKCFLFLLIVLAVLFGMLVRERIRRHRKKTEAPAEEVRIACGLPPDCHKKR